uniref:Protection of telomeres protein 1 ssDNA-binding domain-containing protein n=1 Tax=Panagrolaimus sp. PS1159 TaxID=55785 RepID=A0AC35F2X6_9BILA
MNPLTMAPDKYVYTKLNEIEDSSLKEFNIYGIIKDVFHKVSYDRRGEYQNEYRMKLSDGTTGAEDINVTAFVPVEQIPNDVFENNKIVRFHRLQKSSLRNGGFYLFGRIGPVSSVLLFDLPTPGTRFKFNPSYRSSVDFSQSKKDEEILADLISKANEILGNDDSQQPTTSSSPPENTPALRRSPRKIPLKTSSQVTKTQPSSTTKTPARHQQSHTQPPLSSRRSACLRSKIPDMSTVVEESPEREVDEPAAAEVSTEEQQINLQHDSPVSRRINHRQQQHRSDDPSPQMNERKMFTEMGYLVCGNSRYYNILCQVVSCYRTLRGDVFLRVWDGTRNPRITTQMTFDKNDATYVAASNFLPGDYIALINIHFFLPKTCILPCFVMHEGEGTIRTEKGMIAAGRKLIKLIAAEHRTAYNHIDTLIKTHEPYLPVLEEDPNDITQECPMRLPEASDEISPRSSPAKKNSQFTVSPQRTPTTQASTITLSSDGSSCICVSPSSPPNRDIEIISVGHAGSSSSQRNPFHPRPQFSSPKTSNPSTLRRFITIPDATVPRLQTGVFARRPQQIQFDTPQHQLSPQPKRSKLTQSPQKSQGSVSTQSIFDRYRDGNNEYDSSQSQHAEVRRLEAITDTQLEEMWLQAENPDFYL